MGPKVNIRTFPAYRHLGRSLPLSQDEALAKLQDYLLGTEEHPHLHPDAVFINSVPAFKNDSTGGITLHNLRRIEQGLDGVVLKPESGDIINPYFEPYESPHYYGKEPLKDHDNCGDWGIRKSSPPADGQLHAGVPEDPSGQGATATLNDEPMQNYQEQMREQGFGIVEGDIGQDSNAKVHGGNAQPSWVAPDDQRRKRSYLDARMDELAPKTDKEARKRAKKERSKNEQRLREQERQSKPTRSGETISKDDDEIDATYAGEDEIGASATDGISTTVEPPPQRNERRDSDASLSDFERYKRSMTEEQIADSIMTSQNVKGSGKAKTNGTGKNEGGLRQGGNSQHDHISQHRKPRETPRRPQANGLSHERASPSSTPGTIEYAMPSGTSLRKRRGSVDDVPSWGSNEGPMYNVPETPSPTKKQAPPRQPVSPSQSNIKSSKALNGVTNGSVKLDGQQDNHVNGDDDDLSAIDTSVFSRKESAYDPEKTKRKEEKRRLKEEKRSKKRRKVERESSVEL